LEFSIALDCYAFFALSSSIVMNTLLGPNFPTIAIEFNGQIPQTLNPNFIVFFSQGLQQGLVHPFNKYDIVKFKIVSSFHC
jgi:hypothetical protein